MVAVFLFQESRWGLRLRASREDEVAARASAIGVYTERRTAWILSAFIVGIGGALYGQLLGTFNADAFYLDDHVHGDRDARRRRTDEPCRRRDRERLHLDRRRGHATRREPAPTSARFTSRRGRGSRRSASARSWSSSWSCGRVGSPAAARSRGRSRARFAGASSARKMSPSHRLPPRPLRHRTATEHASLTTKGEQLSTRCLVVGAGVVGAATAVPPRRSRCGRRADRRRRARRGHERHNVRLGGREPAWSLGLLRPQCRRDGGVPETPCRAGTHGLVPLARIARVVDRPRDGRRAGRATRRASRRGLPGGVDLRGARPRARAGRALRRDRRAGRILPGRGLRIRRGR